MEKSDPKMINVKSDDVKMNRNDVTWGDEEARDIVINDYRAFMFGLRCLVFGLWSLVFGLWSSVFDLRYLVFGIILIQLLGHLGTI